MTSAPRRASTSSLTQIGRLETLVLTAQLQTHEGMMFDPNPPIESRPLSKSRQPKLSYEVDFANIESKKPPVLIGIDLGFELLADGRKAGTKTSTVGTFLKHSHNSVKLKVALQEGGNLHLLHGSLLRPEVGQKHAQEMTHRFLRKAEGIARREKRKQIKFTQMLGRPYRRGEPRIKFWSQRESFRFITILHEVVPLDAGEAVNAVRRMKHQLTQAFKQVPGVSCLGAFEVEVTSVKLMRNICDRTQAARKQATSKSDFDSERLERVSVCSEREEFRKLTVIEGMVKDLKQSLHQNEQSELLVHFHGVICAESSAKLKAILETIQQNPKWNKYPRQVLAKKLTRKYGNTEKSVKKNLADMAAYMTKGGNDWVKKRPYLRYKIKFNEGMSMSDEEIESLNVDTNEALSGDEDEQNKVVDLLSLSVEEINVLALTVSEMMKLAPKGKGYQFVHGRW